MKETKNIYKEVFLKFNLKGMAFIPVELKDGSVYYIDKVYELKALDMKLQSEDISLDDFKYIIAIETEKHWNDKTVPTKFGTTSWEHYLKDKFAWEVYPKYSTEEYNKQLNYYRQFGIDYSKVSCSCWEDDLMHPKRKLKNYRIINDDIAIADSELKGGGTELIMKWKGEVHKFDDKCSMDVIRKQNKYASQKVKQFKGQIFKDQAELAGQVIYQYIRGFMMGIIISEGTKGQTGAVLLGKDSVTKVNDKGYIKIGKEAK